MSKSNSSKSLPKSKSSPPITGSGVTKPANLGKGPKPSAESRFVSGSKQTKAPKPKSLTPKTNSTKSGDKKRAGVYGKSVPY